MTTLILPPRHTGDVQRMWWAAGRLGWKVRRAMGWRVEPVRGEVVVYVCVRLRTSSGWTG